MKTLLLCTLAILPLGSLAADISEQCLNEISSRNLRIVVTKEAGGGHDQYARIIARTMAATTGARVQVSNIVGGNGSLGMQVVAFAGEESLTLGLFERERVIHPIATTDTLDLSDFHALGIFAREPDAWVARAGFNLDEYRGRTLVVSITDIFPAAARIGLSAESLGLSVAAVSGYSGSTDALAAILRDEVELSVYSLTSVLRAASSGELAPVLVLSDGPSPGYESLPYLAGPGGVVDQYSKNLDPETRANAMGLARVTTQLSDSIRGLFVSRLVNPNIHRCLVEVVEQVIFSEQFAVAAANENRPIAPMTAEDARQLLLSSYELANEYQPLLTSILETMLE
ncbi:MAG: hypothetical protein O2971_08710 [Proteobacteria bacterium]|nr:hypothetical protein [Pseudomonadota bacterium]